MVVRGCAPRRAAPRSARRRARRSARPSRAGRGPPPARACVRTDTRTLSSMPRARVTTCRGIFASSASSTSGCVSRTSLTSEWSTVSGSRKPAAQAVAAAVADVRDVHACRRRPRTPTRDDRRAHPLVLLRLLGDLDDLGVRALDGRGEAAGHRPEAEVVDLRPVARASSRSSRRRWPPWWSRGRSRRCPRCGRPPRRPGRNRPSSGRRRTWSSLCSRCPMSVAPAADGQEGVRHDDGIVAHRPIVQEKSRPALEGACATTPSSWGTPAIRHGEQGLPAEEAATLPRADRSSAPPPLADATPPPALASVERLPSPIRCGRGRSRSPRAPSSPSAARTPRGPGLRAGRRPPLRRRAWSPSSSSAAQLWLRIAFCRRAARARGRRDAHVVAGAAAASTTGRAVARVFGGVAAVASLVVAWYLGVLSPAPMLVVLGVAFFAMSDDRRRRRSASPPLAAGGYAAPRVSRRRRRAPRRRARCPRSRSTAAPRFAAVHPRPARHGPRRRGRRASRGARRSTRSTARSRRCARCARARRSSRRPTATSTSSCAWPRAAPGRTRA